jgi:hypothetical protein
MASTAFTATIPSDRIDESRQLLSELNKDVSGLAERARVLGYHRERMWLRPTAGGNAELIVYLEFKDDVSLQSWVPKVAAYENDFTRWWNPRFGSFLETRPASSEGVTELGSTGEFLGGPILRRGASAV